MATSPEDKFVYPDTPALARAQARRSVTVGAVIGAVFNALCSTGTAAVTAAGTYLMGKSPQLADSLQAAATVGGAMSFVWGSGLVAYISWPRYVVWQDEQYYDWHCDKRSDLPFRYTAMSVAACAATSLTMSWGISKLADKLEPPATPQAVSAPAAQGTAQLGKLPQLRVI